MDPLLGLTMIGAEPLFGGGGVLEPLWLTAKLIVIEIKKQRPAARRSMGTTCGCFLFNDSPKLAIFQCFWQPFV